MLSTMDWISILTALITGGIAGGVAFGMMRGQNAALSAEIASLRRELDKVEARVAGVVSRVDHLHNGKS